MTEAGDLVVFRESYEELVKTFDQLGRPLPKNEGSRNRFDGAICPASVLRTTNETKLSDRSTWLGSGPSCLQRAAKQVGTARAMEKHGLCSLGAVVERVREAT